MTKNRRGRNFLNWLLLLVVFYLMILNPVWCLLLSRLQAEAMGGLSSIARGQQIRIQSGEALAQSFSEMMTGFDSNFRYVYYISPTEFQGRDPTLLGLSNPPDFAALGAPEPGVGEDSFTAVAIGNIDQDSELDVWYVTRSRQMVNSHCDYWSFWAWAAETASDTWHRIHGRPSDASNDIELE